MLVDDTMDNHEAEPGPFFLGREVGFKDSVDLLLGDAGAGVLHDDRYPAILINGSNGKFPSSGHGLHCILYKID